MKINLVFARNLFLILGTSIYIFLFYLTHGIWGAIADIIILILTFIIDIKIFNTKLFDNLLNVLNKSKFIRNTVKVISFCLMILFPIVIFDIVLMIVVSSCAAAYYIEKNK